MSIVACLQLASQRGNVNGNIERADEIIMDTKPENLHLLCLPEYAFCGSGFQSLSAIHPSLESTAEGPTSVWAKKVAHERNCIVTAGYAETVDIRSKWPTSEEYYSSVVAAEADGETWNCRKSFVCSVDKRWALKCEDGLFCEEIKGFGNVAMGIGTDLNQDAERTSNTWNFASHVVHNKAKLIILSMSSSIPQATRSDSRSPEDPDLCTLSEWLARLEPIIRDDTKDETICVFANQVGTEGDTVFAGTSAVLGLRNGEVHVYGMLGKGEEGLLIADISQRAKRYIIKQGSTVSIVDAAQKFFPTETPEPPSWLPRTVKGQNVAFVSMKQNRSIELDQKTLDYLCRILWPVNPKYLLVLMGEPEHKLGLNRLSQLKGIWEEGIATIYYHAPPSRATFNPATVKFRRVTSADQYVLYTKIRRKQHEPIQSDSEQSSVDENHASSLPGSFKEPLPDVADTGNQNFPNVEEDNTLGQGEELSKDEAIPVSIPKRPKSPKSRNTCVTSATDIAGSPITDIEDSPTSDIEDLSSSFRSISI